MAKPDYQGILYPDRAESLSRFNGYRIFLDHWDQISLKMKSFYEDVAVRSVSRAVTIYGPQGTGKTLFANQFEETFKNTKSIKEKHNITFNKESLWHRISGGIERDVDLVWDATASTHLMKVENNVSWVESLIKWHGGRHDQVCMVIADNAERSYFRQGLSGLSLSEYLKVQNDPGFMTVIAQSFVDICRTKIPNTLFVILSNDKKFLEDFKSEVDKQHKGLIEHSPLPIPTSADKERIVRVNTNRLNKMTYWYCLDKAGIEGKKSVQKALNNASNYPDSFAAVDQAVRNPAPSRMGRPGRRNLLSLVVLHNGNNYPDFAKEIGNIEYVEFEKKWASSYKYRDGWAQNMISDPRKVRLMESEWQLRVIFLGNPFIQALLHNDLSSQAQCKRILNRLREVYGPGTQHLTRETVRIEIEEEIEKWIESDIDLSSFWDKGQSRSADYEAKLRLNIVEYNKTGSGFLSYRPDAIVSPYRPCSILSAVSDSERDINEAIRRDCHVFEFSAFKSLDKSRVFNYMSSKISNYIEITQEQ